MVNSFFKNIFFSATQYLQFSFRFYKLSSILCIIVSILNVLEINFDNHFLTNYISLFSITFLISLIVENINFEDIFKKIKIKNIIYHVVFIAILSSLVHFFITSKFNFNFNFNIHMLHYVSLSISLVLLFVILNISKDSFKNLLQFYNFFGILSLFYIFCLFLSGVIFSSLYIMFNVENAFKLALSLFVLEGCLFVLIFLGKEGSLNHFLSFSSSNKEEPNTKAQDYFFIILNIFAYIYSALLIVYIPSYILGFSFIEESYSIVHLTIWFCLFGIFLSWLNIARGNIKYQKVFLAILLFLSILSFYAIIIRINQYGFTPSRYGILALCIFVICSILYMLFFKYKIHFILYFAILILIFSAFIPRFNAIDFSIKSQLKILESLDETPINAKRIESITLFLYAYGYIERKDIKYSDNTTAADNVVRFTTNRDYRIFDITGFDILLDFNFNAKLNYDEPNGKTLYKYEVDYKLDTFTLYKNDETALIINDFTKILLEESKSKQNKPIILEIEQGNNKFKFCFIGFSFADEYNHISFYLMIKNLDATN